MKDEQLIIDFLKKSGFQMRGVRQFTKKGTGTIHIKKWCAETVLYQIMELGGKHQAKQIRDALMIKSELVDTVEFNPHV